MAGPSAFKLDEAGERGNDGIGPALVEAGSADLVMNVSRFESPRRL